MQKFLPVRSETIAQTPTDTFEACKSNYNTGAYLFRPCADLFTEQSMVCTKRISFPKQREKRAPREFWVGETELIAFNVLVCYGIFACCYHYRKTTNRYRLIQTDFVLVSNHAVRRNGLNHVYNKNKSRHYFPLPRA